MLKLRNISKYYHSNDVVALGLRKINLDFKLGEFVAVTGESGSGKSTLLNVISGLDTYEDGEMYVDGEETSYFEVEEWESYRRQYIGFVFQSYNIIDSYSVLENVMVALQIQGYDKEKRKERALELIEKVGLSSHVHHKASKLSGGQKQRAVIARALAKDCPIIVADEPTGNLDSESADRIMTLLAEISKEKLVIVVTHNYEEVEAYATRKIRMFDGEVVEDKKIKARKDVNDSVTLAHYYMNVLSLIGIALRNLVRTPKRTTFTLIVGMFIALIFMFSYGSYKDSDNDSYYGYSNIFSNVMDSRIVVNNFDSSELTDNDLAELAKIKNVKKVLEHDVILDSTMFLYVKDTYVNYYEEAENEEEIVDRYYAQDYFVTPVSAISKLDLSKGRLPETATEVVIEQPWGNEFEVGDKVFIGTDYVTEDGIPTSAIEVTIVGLTKSLGGWRERIILTDEVVEKYENVINAYTGNGARENAIIRFSMDASAEDGLVFENPEEEYYYYKYGAETIQILIDNTLNDNEVELNSELIYIIAGKQMIDLENNPDFYLNESYQFTSDAGYYTHTSTLKVVGQMGSEEENYYYYGQMVSMNQTTFNSFIEDKVYQAAVLVEGAYESTNVIKEIELLGFNAIYPAGIADPFEQVTALISGIGFAVLIAFFTLIIWVVTYLILRNVQKAKQKDYLIFRSIGASKKDLNRVTVLELALSMTFSYIIVIVLLVINEQFNTFIPHYIRFFTIGGYVMIYAVLMILAYLLSSSFNKRIFSKSVISSLKQE